MQRLFVHPSLEDIHLEGILYALADPVRMSIVLKFMTGPCEMNCTSAAPCNLPKSTLSHHYKVLREFGLIRSERRGTEIINSLRAEEINSRYPGLLEAIRKAALNNHQ